MPAIVHVFQRKKGEDGNMDRNMDMTGVAEVNWLTYLVTRLHDNQKLLVTNIMTQRKFLAPSR